VANSRNQVPRYTAKSVNHPISAPLRAHLSVRLVRAHISELATSRQVSPMAVVTDGLADCYDLIGEELGSLEGSPSLCCRSLSYAGRASSSASKA
jgi:hypothetical protein